MPTRQRYIGKPGHRVYTMTFESESPPRGHIVFLPPFCEEMNRCRTVVAAQGRAFAQQGYHCTLIDFWGTGDSEGELHLASLDVWDENLRDVLDHIKSRGEVPLALWGMRVGALLATRFVSMNPHSGVSRLLLWQPVSSGNRYITQLLRLKLANLSSGGDKLSSTREIRELFSTQTHLEVAGYTINTAMLQDLDALRIAECSGLSEVAVDWIENVSEGNTNVSKASQAAIEKLSAEAKAVNVQPFVSPPFWQLPKRSSAPDLIRVTNEAMLR